MDARACFGRRPESRRALRCRFPALKVRGSLMKPRPTSELSPGWVPEAALRLRPLEREVLELTAGQLLSSRRAARRLGLSVRQVERRLARALRKLDRELRRTGATRSPQ